MGNNTASGKKKVLIKVEGTQEFVDREPAGQADRIEFVTIGTYHLRPHEFYIMYKESELAGMAGVTTTLRVKDGRVTLNRMGAAGLKQEFEPGVLHRSVYNTNFGSLWLSILTKQLETDLTAHGGRISLEYDLFVDDILISHNGLTITLKEEPPQ